LIGFYIKYHQPNARNCETEVLHSYVRSAPMNSSLMILSINLLLIHMHNGS
jgi:hypothetical protein